MGKKPVSGARGLVWVGLALACISGLGCTNGGPRKPLTQGSIRENPYARPPAPFGSPAGNPATPATDLNKFPPPPSGGRAGLTGSGMTTDPIKPASGMTNTANRPALMKTGEATTPGTSTGGSGGLGGFEQGGRVPPGALPGNTEAGNPLGQLDPVSKPSAGVYPPIPATGGTGTQTANFGHDTASKSPAPIATGSTLLPPPPSPGRDPITSTSTPLSIPGAPLSTTTSPTQGSPALGLPTEGSPLPGSPTPGMPLPGTPVSGSGIGSTSGYPPIGKPAATITPTTTTTAPPVGYTSPGGAMPGDVLPPIGDPNP